MTAGCPGQSLQQWKFDDIYTVPCPHCGYGIEFFRDDLSLPCPRCRAEIMNPRADRRCEDWCKEADTCAQIRRRS